MAQVKNYMCYCLECMRITGGHRFRFNSEKQIVDEVYRSRDEYYVLKKDNDPLCHGKYCCYCGGKIEIIEIFDSIFNKFDPNKINKACSQEFLDAVRRPTAYEKYLYIQYNEDELKWHDRYTGRNAHIGKGKEKLSVPS